MTASFSARPAALLARPALFLLTVLASLAFMGFCSRQAGATTYYVSPSGSNSNPGTQALPFLTIQQGINTSVDGDTVVVGDGTYTGPGDVDLDFGGYSITVTSTNGPASTIINCGGYASSDGSGDHRGFYLHNLETSAVISGLTIENGYESNDIGGGIDNVNAGLTVQNCILKDNTANGVDGGGGISNDFTINVINCTLSDNSAPNGGGGGIRNRSHGNGPSSVTNCTLTGNSALYGGGGILSKNTSSSPSNVTNCTLTGNSAVDGGGIEIDPNNGGGPTNVTNCMLIGNTVIDNSNPYGGGGGGISCYATSSVTNCTLIGNTVSGQYGFGGGIYNDQFTTSSVTNCTLIGNSAPEGNGGNICNLGTSRNGGSLTLINDIAYGDAGGEINNQGTIAVTYCDVQGGFSGTNNLDADPKFINSPTDLHLQPGSPCLGAGTATGAPATTIDGKTRPNPPSMGAYEAAAGGAPTAVTVANVSGAAGQTVTLSATLKTTGGVAISGQTLTFSVDSTVVGTGVTNSSGVATKTYVVPTTLSAGSHTITAAFAGDAGDAASSGAGTLTVNKANTVVTVGARTGAHGTTVVLKSYLKTSGGAVLPGKTLNYTVNGVAAGSAVTDSTGLASLSYAIPASAPSGGEPIAVSFAGDSGDNPSSGTGTLTVTGSAPATSVTVAAVSGAPGQTVSLSATLKAGTALLSGKTLSFQVDGAAVGTAVTSGSGVATLPYAIPAGAAPGSHPITASFAGDGGDAASSGSGTLTVTGASKLATVVTVGARSGKAGTTVVLKSILKTSGGAVLAGKPLSYVVNGVSAGSAVTDSTGLASLTYTIPASAPAGSEPIAVSFGGDGGDNPSSGKGTLTVS